MGIYAQNAVVLSLGMGLGTSGENPNDRTAIERLTWFYVRKLDSTASEDVSLRTKKLKSLTVINVPPCILA
jgi:hypothetical protein